MRDFRCQHPLCFYNASFDLCWFYSEELVVIQLNEILLTKVLF